MEVVPPPPEDPVDLGQQTPISQQRSTVLLNQPIESRASSFVPLLLWLTSITGATIVTFWVTRLLSRAEQRSFEQEQEPQQPVQVPTVTTPPFLQRNSTETNERLSRLETQLDEVTDVLERMSKRR